MNEQMQKLFQEAVAYAGSIAGNDEDSNYAEWFNIYKAKFAELIVRECISTLEEKIHRSIDNEGDEIWADLILKEHFGVEK